ncbi:hypothetical protein Vqi01_57390 [Micromonospora qiuiae]|uniref:TetR family transcriptional regulator n=1 Tax=Micromonospora qiuiae TaxID=502268 RepID=A0ABQ4JM50_9ACTN|nr:hypothetical protein [Micromonospora qiuiae]GIJ30577.1 hypothetical protein Vqi01_57390 [Micromonospora qiuiae]
MVELATIAGECGAHADRVGENQLTGEIGRLTEFCVGGPGGASPRSATHVRAILAPEPQLHAALPALNCPPDSFDAILAAHTGFLMAGALATMPTGLQAIAEDKLRLATAATQWLQHRYAHTQ